MPKETSKKSVAHEKFEIKIHIEYMYGFKWKSEF